MFWFQFVDNVKTTLTTNNFVVGADLLYTCTHFHVRIILLPGG